MFIVNANYSTNRQGQKFSFKHAGSKEAVARTRSTTATLASVITIKAFNESIERV